jgi:mannose-1-phosphate guanylyltransferase
LLRLIGNLTLIEQTVERVKPLVKAENIIIITNQDYVAPMRSLLPELPPANIVGEPVGRDTGPCNALAAAMVRARDKSGDAVMVMLPADHVIRDSASMLQVVRDSVEAAESGHIVTIGVNPTFPSTGYGYIHCGDAVDFPGLSTNFFSSIGFKEKPDLDTAEKFLREACYRWNSGMFVWSVKTIMSAFKRFAPELEKLADLLYNAETGGHLEKTLESEFAKSPKISIDYAVMEKADNVIVAECTFDWDDVGSWTALRNQIRPEQNNNVVRGLFESVNSHDCIVVGDAKHLIAAVDVQDLIIVHTDDATLVCNAKSAQRIKDLLQEIGRKPELEKFL